MDWTARLSQECEKFAMGIEGCYCIVTVVLMHET